MTFADLRKHVLNNLTLSTDFFGELVTIQPTNGASAEITAKISHRQSRGTRSKPSAFDDEPNVDVQEEIEVCVSRDPAFTGGPMLDKPSIGDRLTRSSDVDPDRRPFGFGGEVLHQSDVHAVYVYKRPKRIVQGARK